MTDNPETRRPDAPEGRPRRWMRWLLVASLALNLLVVGLAVGAVLRPGAHDRDRHRSMSVSTAMFRELPREDRRALWGSLREGSGHRGPDRMQDAAAIGTALRAVPFEPDPLRDLLSEHSRHHQEWLGSIHEAWLERVAGMNDAERAAYADRFEAALRNRRGRDRGGRRDGRDR